MVLQEYFFANYRLLIDESLTKEESLQFLSEFKNPMPYEKTFTIFFGLESELDAKSDEITKSPAVCETELFTIHKTADGWALASIEKADKTKMLVLGSSDYSEITLYARKKKVFVPQKNLYADSKISFSNSVRPFLESGITLCGGIPLHAALIEKDGYGVVFLGRSGMGKSTQAKLWKKYLDADFIIGDRPSFYKADGNWYGCGMPWDGKDCLKRQKKVKIKALVSLEQAKQNCIRKLNQGEAMQVLLHQTVMPMWDNNAMEKLTLLMAALTNDIPFYHLKNLADEECVNITYKMLYGK